MPCKLCKKSHVWKFTNKQQLCNSCFAKYFEKKVKSTIRKYKMPINKIKSRSLKAKVINKIIKELPERKGRISIDNLNNISDKILNTLMYKDNKELKELLPSNQPLYFLSDKEILLYGKIKNIKGKIKERENKKIREINSFIEKIEQKKPDIRYNIVNALIRC